MIWQIDKPRRLPLPLICQDILNLSVTTQQNLTKLDRMQDLVLQQVLFLGRSENRDCHTCLGLAETFSTSSLQPLNRIQKNSTRYKISTSSIKFVFMRSCHPDLRLDETFSTSPQCWTEFDETRQKASTPHFLYQVCVFKEKRPIIMSMCSIPKQSIVALWASCFEIILANVQLLNAKYQCSTTLYWEQSYD